jgi:hypothetical protein
MYVKNLITGAIFPILYANSPPRIDHICHVDDIFLIGSKEYLSPAWSDLYSLRPMRYGTKIYSRTNFDPHTGKNDEGYLYGMWIMPSHDSSFWRIITSFSSNVEALELMNIE